MAKILLAVLNGELEFGELLSQHEICYAKSLNSARKLIKVQSFDAIICGVSFDESRMFDFLRAASSEPKAAGVPFICCRVRESAIPRSKFDTLQSCCRLLGAECVDFCQMKQEGKESDFADFVQTAINKRFRD